jgi:predicted nucleotide-binding protein
MAQKSKRSTPVAVAPALPPSQAAQLLKIQFEKGTALLSRRPIISADEQSWEAVTHDVLIRAFGSESPNVSAVMNVGKYGYFGGGNEQDWAARRAEDMETRLKIVAGLLELLHSSENVARTETGTHASIDMTPEQSNRVFLVHGHDESAIHETARWLERFGLRVTILREEPNSGRTIIEKFIDSSDVAFAVILLTGDDRGGPLNTSYEEQNTRSRQNVILELGFFLGKLGRKRVCALYREGVEIPSDYAGVLFVPIDRGGAWRLTLARELKAAGLDIDMNQAV